MTSSSPASFDRKVGRGLNLNFFDFQVKSTGIKGLVSHQILQSNRAGEFAVTREARLGDRKLIFHFSKIYAFKNMADKVALRNFTGTHVGR